MIFNEMVGDGMGHLKSWERARQIRLELMDERGKLKQDIDRETFSRTCMCFTPLLCQCWYLFVDRELLRALSDLYKSPKNCGDHQIQSLKRCFERCERISLYFLDLF